MLSLPAVVACAAFWQFHPTIQMRDGKSATLIGSGPPVLFSPGVYGRSTWRVYGQLLRTMGENVTVAVVPGAVTTGTVDALTTELGVDRIGLVAHAACDPSLLRSRRVCRAALIDPIARPMLNSVQTATPTLVVRTELLETDERFPDFHRMLVRGDAVRESTWVDVGHADVLDDTWAELASKSRVWRGARSQTVLFGQWDRTAVRDALAQRKQVRTDYRVGVANEIVEFLLQDQGGATDTPAPLTSTADLEMAS